MKTAIVKKNQILGGITEYVEPPPMHMINTKQVGFNKEFDYIKVRLCSNPTSSTLEKYEVELEFFENN